MYLSMLRTWADLEKRMIRKFVLGYDLPQATNPQLHSQKMMALLAATIDTKPYSPTNSLSNKEYIYKKKDIPLFRFLSYLIFLSEILKCEKI